MFGLDILLIALVAAALPVCIWRPWIGVLVFVWLGYLNPHRMVGGLAYNMPLSKLVAVATLIGVLFTKQRCPLPRRREVYLLGALWITFLASTMFTAIEPARAWIKFVEVSKVLLMTGMTLVLFQDRSKLRVLLLVTALSIGFHGVDGALWGFRTGFQHRLFGPPDSSLADNNELGFAFTIVLPLLAFIRQEESSALLRGVLLITFGLTIVALFATYSRGSLIGACIVLPLIASQIRTKDVALLATGLAACLVIYVFPPQWAERMLTITPTAYRTDRSGALRMKAWYVACRLGIDHPLLGAGFHPFSPAVYQRYLPGYSDYHDAHNHFLQVFAEHGLTGLVLFVGLMVAVLLRLWRMASAARGDPRRKWIAGYTRMLAIAIIAFALGGVFVNMPYFDLYFELVAVTLVLEELTASANGSACTVLDERLVDAVKRRTRVVLRLT